MKLVEILAEEMEEWPKGVTHLTQSAVDREIYNAQDGKDTDSLESLEPRFDAIKSHDERGKYPVVTRAQWQAERDRQNGGEWKRHRGNSQPVDEGTWVEVKLRCGDIQQGLANAFLWRHADCDVAANIMQYRVISQPQAEEVEMIHSQESLKRAEINLMGITEGTFTQGPISLDNEVIYPAGPEWHTDQIDGPIKWRDTVNELDAYIEEFTREREALINRLAEEGFALLPAMNPVMGASDISIPIEQWEIGDIVEVVSVSDQSGAPLGIFKITDIDSTDPKYELDDQYFPNHDQMKFVRRP